MDGYLLIKSAHIISMVAWMAGLFYLPRLFVYHAGVPAGSPQSELFKVMERRLYKAIMVPAMAATWIFGLWAAIDADWFSGGNYWLHAKLALVVVLSGFQGACGRWLKDFAADRNMKDGRFFRMVNEVPTLILIAVVLLVVLKPF